MRLLSLPLRSKLSVRETHVQELIALKIVSPDAEVVA